MLKPFKFLCFVLLGIIIGLALVYLGILSKFYLEGINVPTLGKTISYVIGGFMGGFFGAIYSFKYGVL